MLQAQIVCVVGFRLWGPFIEYERNVRLIFPESCNRKLIILTNNKIKQMENLRAIEKFCDEPDTN